MSAVGCGHGRRVYEQYAGEGEVPAAQLGDGEGRVVDCAEGVACDEKERKSERGGKVRGGEVLRVGREDSAG